MECKIELQGGRAAEFAPATAHISNHITRHQHCDHHGRTRVVASENRSLLLIENGLNLQALPPHQFFRFASLPEVLFHQQGKLCGGGFRPVSIQAMTL
eukprot:1621767-Rhodomonas_salina.4